MNARRVARNKDSFGTGAAARVIHNVSLEAAGTGTRRAVPGIPNGASLAEDFDTHFDNLVSVVTHGNEEVAGALTEITTTASTQHAEIKKLLVDLKAAMPSAGGGRRNNGGAGGRDGGRNTQLPATKKDKLHRKICQLQAAVKHKWVVGGFCSSHSHGVDPDHDSANCAG